MVLILTHNTNIMLFFIDKAFFLLLDLYEHLLKENWNKIKTNKKIKGKEIKKNVVESDFGLFSYYA